MTRIATDSDYAVHVDEDAEGVLLSITHGVGSTSAVLRPTQAERLAAELLAYANGDHRLPPGAVRPQRIVEPRVTGGWNPLEHCDGSGETHHATALLAEMAVERDALREALLCLYAAAEEAALAQHEHEADAILVAARLVRARAVAKGVLGV